MTTNPTHKPNATAVSDATSPLIDKGHAIDTATTKGAPVKEDKRETARHEHTSHFTNRANENKQ